MDEENLKLKEKIRQMPTMPLISTINEMLEDEEVSIKILKIFRDEMVRRKFNSPFGFLINVAKQEEFNEKESGDRKKQIAYFRKLAILKKYALFSTMIAIAARRIKETVERNNYSDLTAFLPLNGNYLNNILQYGYLGLITYRNIYDILKGTGETEEAYLYEIEGNEYTYTKKVSKDKDISRYLNENERVVKKKKSAVIRGIIKSRFVAKALSSAITGYSGFIAFREAEKSQSNELKLYNEILKRKGYIPFYLVDSYLEQDKALKEELSKNNLLENGITKDNIKKEILKKRREIAERMEKISKLMFVVPLSKHYLLKNSLQRKTNPLYPSLITTPTPKQLKVLGIANSYIGFPVEKVVEEKLRHEEYGDNKLVSIAIIGKNYGVKNSSKFFGVSEEEVIKAINYFERIKLGRGKDFLEKLKD